MRVCVCVSLFFMKGRKKKKKNDVSEIFCGSIVLVSLSLSYLLLFVYSSLAFHSDIDRSLVITRPRLIILSLSPPSLIHLHFPTPLLLLPLLVSRYLVSRHS